MGIVEIDGVKLGISITGKPGEWQVAALATPAREPTDVLDNHSHEYLGEFKDFEKARRVGTLYAKKWLETKLRAEKKCACGPIRKGRR
jgi:hypothetical protein